MVGEGFFPGRESGLGTEIAGLLDLRRACPFPDCSWGAKLIDIPAGVEISAIERLVVELDFAGTNLDFTKGRNLMSETQRRLSGKSTLITGASAGIGQACARALAAEGARLVLTARRQERLDVLAAEVQAAGSEAKIVVGDAREEETTRQATAVAKDSFGGLDILINNTGVGNYKNLVDTSAAEYDEMMDTNVRSTFLFTGMRCP